MKIGPKQPLAWVVVSATSIIMSPIVVVVFCAWLLAETFRRIADGLWSASWSAR